ncbi:hypothetical protein ILUMI_19270 [Ignelater luminosus]|uniref:RNA-directed DNA polymerase n=1 Tax=Ignelater luminosus TaxID=2038154 RepID=A0A8K0G5M4_IGNLU|nr:hypothetical protein ILUMI_19270 [Ignelater luminosus]
MRQESHTCALDHRCAFGDLTDSITICGLKSDNIREKLLRDDTLNFEKALKLCLSIEESKQQSVKISTSTANIHGVSTRKLERVRSYGENKHCSSSGEIATPGHSRQAPGQWYQRGAINSNSNTKQWNVKMLVNKIKTMQFKIDTGSMVDVLPVGLIKLINVDRKLLIKSDISLTNYSNQHIPVLGVCYLNYHKPLVAIFNKPLVSAPLRLQRMLMKIQRYDIELHYVPGKYLYLADTLSRTTSTDNKITESEDTFDEEVEAHVGLLRMHLNATDHKVMEIQKATSEDARVQPIVQHYHKFRNELTEYRGLIYKGDKLIIPLNCRPDLLTKLHYGHFGVNKTKHRARLCFYWPGMARDIEKMVLMVDYYSKYIEIAKLEDSTSSNQVIVHLKSIFARHGISDVVMSDNGPQFTSKLFKKFSQEWESSPLYPQSNGLVERNVQIVKNSLIKAKQANRDITLRDTPPINESLLISRTPNKNLVKDALRKRQESKRYYYNRGTKPLNPLKRRQKIYVKTQLKDKEWRPATIENRKEQPRSYMFKNSEGDLYTRNRRFINIIPDIPDDEVQREELPKASQSIREDDNETILNESDFEIFNVPTQSSRGRPIKIPNRLKY